MPEDDPFEIEEWGSEKLVLHRSGWYHEEGGNREFCKYSIRYVIHRDSPLIRIFHTWIYTGDGNRDRIANMGWRLKLSETMRPDGFLASFDERDQWLTGDYLLQYAHDEFQVVAGDEIETFPDGRATGVARAAGPEARFYLGVRDFWQSFPSELEFHDGTLWFHNWPRHGKPHPDPMVEVETAQLLKFAHSGEVLDFRLPEAFTEDPLDYSHHRGSNSAGAWAAGEPESVNAQGVARTEEFWLYVAPAAADGGDTVRVLEALNDELIRPVVDPRWVAQSGAFHEIAFQDRESFPDLEAHFEKVAESTGERGTQMGFYGMWLYGERAWNSLPHSDLYRGLLKAHRGFPFSWVPYARSGDARLLNHARIDSRRITDVSFCHYVSDRVRTTGTGRTDLDRGLGPWSPSALPWAGKTSPKNEMATGLQPKRKHLWNSWYLTGYGRGYEMARKMDALVVESEGVLSAGMGSRGNDVHLKNSLIAYKNNFDPWFIVRAHYLAREQREAWENDRWQPYGTFWATGDSDYHRYTGCEEHLEYFLKTVDERAGVRVGPLAYAWQTTGEDIYLRKIIGVLAETYGWGERMGSDFLHDFPLGVGAMASVDELPPGIYRPFFQRRHAYEQLNEGTYVYRTPPAVLYKEAGAPLKVFLGTIRLQTHQRENDEHRYWIIGPDGSEVMSGSLTIDTFQNQPGEYVEIPAEAPGGLYRVNVEIRSIHENSMQGHSHLRGIRFPISETGTREVIEINEESMGPASTVGHTPPGYFFYVPEGVTEFSVEGVYSYFGPEIRDPDGRPVWQLTAGSRSGNAQVTVVPEHQGKLWRIVGANFRMDPQIPPYYAVDPDRWFNPDEKH